MCFMSSGVLLLTLVTGASPGGSIAGTVKDPSGAPLPGVSIGLSLAGGQQRETATDDKGFYAIDSLPAGRHRLTLRLINFATVMRDVSVADAAERADVVMQLALTAAVTVTGARTFRNLADAERLEESLVGIASSASAGAVTMRQLANRPVTRAAAVLESMPGMIVSQHSGEGKANQYYLRGFNLDHGTDFATSVAGVPVNMPTHAHGHGYSDLNFLIPELVSGIQYRKGPYFADQGDFSAAGSAAINYVAHLEREMLTISAGPFGARRVLAAGSPAAAGGRLLYAIEGAVDDGPWRNPERQRKVNGVLRFSRGDTQNGLSVTAMGYHARWNATDQIPERAVQSGALTRYDTVDASDRGRTHRYSLSAERQWGSAAQTNQASVYLLDYGLRLFSNFTYFLDDPVNGDQFEQLDQRRVVGGQYAHRRLTRAGGLDAEHAVGVSVRRDGIGTLGLYRTVGARRTGPIREDSAAVTSTGVYAQTDVTWTPRLRTVLGLRGDVNHALVRAGLADNSGQRAAGIVSPKGSLILGPWRRTEFYVNAGRSFHSNDARGTLTRTDPGSLKTTTPATPLVPALGYEAGLRSVTIPRTQVTAAWWTLRLGSELVFVGDAGTTDSSRPSHRSGLELSIVTSPRRWLHLDLDAALSSARFTKDPQQGVFIPGAVGTVLSAGVGVDGWRGTTASIRWRYFGPRPLTEDGEIRSRASRIATANLRVPVTKRLRLEVDAVNLFNSRASDIDYFYVSRLPGEPVAGVADVHSHPVAPRTILTSLILSF